MHPDSADSMYPPVFAAGCPRASHPALFVLLLLILLTTGCASVPPERVNVNAGETLPGRVLILPARITSNEISAGGVIEEVKAWSEVSGANVERDLRRYAQSRPNLEVVSLPDLTEEERQALDQHLALYDLVGTTAYLYSTYAGKEWEHKRSEFDYSLGDGLRFLKERSGADAALIITGEDYISTAGRKGLFVAAALFGVVIPMGHSYLLAGMVDLDSGEVLWMNLEASGSADLRNPDNAGELVKGLFDEFPGAKQEQ